jgi:hypothetical protein
MFQKKKRSKQSKQSAMNCLAKKKTIMGRPLAAPAKTFAAILIAKLNGLSLKRSTELIEADVSSAPSTVWLLASFAASSGVQTSLGFQQWVKELKESL